MSVEFNPEQCMSRKNLKEGLLIQCSYKRKYGDFCGYHRHNKNNKRFRIDEPLPPDFKYKRIKTNSPILITFKSYLKNQNLKKFKVNDLRFSLEQYKLKKKGKKQELISRLKKFFDIIEYCEKNIDKVVKIQAIFRGYKVRHNLKKYGPGYYNRSKCNNVKDFFTLENIENISDDLFISYKESNGFIYAFDVRSLAKLSDMKQLNPYNRNIIPQQISDMAKTRINLLKKNKKIYCFDNPILTKKQQIIDKLTLIFQKIDTFGNYTDIDWFMNLNLYRLKRYYRILEEIWKYRAQLTEEAKRRIVPSGDVLTANYRTIFRINNTDKLRYIILEEIDKLVSSGINRDEKILGCMYVLTGLTEVSVACAESMPWLIQA